MIKSEDRLFKFILKCCRNRNKPDLHTFLIDINNGKAYVDCREYEVCVKLNFFDDKLNRTFVGTPVAMANLLDKYGAVYDSIDM